MDIITITSIYIAPTIYAVLYILYSPISPCLQGGYNLRPLPHMLTFTGANLDRRQLTSQHGLWEEN